MKEIKFAKDYEQVLSFADPDFKAKHEEHIRNNLNYVQKIGEEGKHLAVCPLCDNPVAILGIYQKIDVAPHARHAKGISIPKIAEYDEYKYLHCPYHVKHADYVKEYVPETEEPQRYELYKIVKENYDKAIYLIEKVIGLRISYFMAEGLAKAYADLRVYNYIDATLYNAPWYLLYGYYGIPLHHLVIRKNSPLYHHLKKAKIILKESLLQNYIYVENYDGLNLLATRYHYSVDKNENLNEWLGFSIVRPDQSIKNAALYNLVTRFSIKVDSHYFENLVFYKNWKPNQKLLDIAAEYMDP